MDKKDINRVKHILEAAQSALLYVKEKQRTDLDNNRMLLSALIRELEIIGEAANSLTSHTKDSFPTIPWKNIINMRNRLIHAYFDINHDLLWTTITEDLPHLISELDNSH